MNAQPTQKGNVVNHQLVRVAALFAVVLGILAGITATASVAGAGQDGEPNPGWSFDTCAADGIEVTLTNVGGGANAKYQVNGKQVTVPPDHHGKTKVADAGEDQSVRITI